MSVGTIVTSIGTLPVEAVKVALNCINEISARDDCVGNATCFLTRVLVQVDSHGPSVFKSQIVTVLALLAFLADTSLEIGAKSVLQIN